tara:strand:- start:1222 stop:1695 length:474 start_codon:yes stop_codon:yes gene_type:complete
MSSAISNSSARRRRTSQPKIQEKNIQNTNDYDESKQQQQQQIFNNDNLPILGIKDSIYFLSNKLRFLENIIKNDMSVTNKSYNDDELDDTLKDVKRSVDELSIKIQRVELNIEKINLVLGIHDNYINQIKNMVEFENVENVKSNDITPQLIEGSDDN